MFVMESGIHKHAEIVGGCWRQVGVVIVQTTIMERTSGMDVILIVIAELSVWHVRMESLTLLVIMEIPEVDLEDKIDLCVHCLVVVVAQQVKRKMETEVGV